jgi:hypothetical protein
MNPDLQQCTQLRVRDVAQIKVHFIPEAEPEPPAVTRRIHEVGSSRDVVSRTVMSRLAHKNPLNYWYTYILTGGFL